MPLYEFACSQCSQDFESLVFPGEKAEDVACPACRSQAVTRKLSATAAPVSSATSMPMAGNCSSSLPPCSPTCCRLPS